jgi:putative ABC transport system permease protein
MHLAALLGSSQRALSRNKMRAILMMAGVALGIALLITLSSVGESTRRETMKRFRNMLGTYDTIILRPGSAKSRGMVSLTNVDPTLKFVDADSIAQLPSVRRVAELQNAFDVDVTYRDRTRTPAIFGVSPNWLDLRGDEVAEGAFLTTGDNRSMARVAILGSYAKADLFPDEDPIGKTIRVGNVPFVVAGVLAPRGAGPGGGNLDNLVLIPVDTASKRLFNRDFLTMLIVQVADPAHPDAAVAQIHDLLRNRHHLAPGALDDFNLTSPAAIMARVTALGSTLRRLVLILAIAATVIGGVVIFSVTLIGVSERRREIGVRRAVGAPRFAVVIQFLLESVVLSGVGGAAGLVLGIGGTQLVSRWQHLPFLIDLRMVAVSAFVSIGLGLVAGVYPAWKASHIDPVEALRG